jgi:hypothetical protein
LSLRKIANNVLKNVLSFNKGDILQRGVFLKKTNDDFLEIISLFEIAFVSGILSENNYQIITSEIKKVILQIEELSRSEKNEHFVESNFFNVNLPKTEINKNENFIKSKIERNISQAFSQDKKFNQQQNFHAKNLNIDKGQTFQPMSFKGTRNDFVSFMKKDLRPQGNNETFSATQDSHKGHADLKNAERRNLIIEEIKIKGSVTIKDVSDKIKDVSEKTIQRELLKMVDENVLKKEGERRWSKYSLRG